MTEIFEQNAIERICNYNLFPVKAKESVDLEIVLDVDTDEFLSIVSEKNNIVFYYYQYLTERELLISGETIDEADSDNEELLEDIGVSYDFDWYLDQTLFPEDYSDEDKLSDKEMDDMFSAVERKLKAEIIGFNKTIDKSMLSKPTYIQLYTILEGVLVGIDFENKELINVSQKALKSLLISFKQKIAKKGISAEDLSMKKEELHDQLLTDRSFQACTNQNLRKQYAEDLWFEPENKWLRLVFKDKYSGRSNRLSDSFVNFIERTYNEYKISKKK